MNKRKKYFSHRNNCYCFFDCRDHILCHCISEKNQLQLTIGTHQISSEEYLACMQSVMYDTKMQIQQQYDVDYDDDFWKKSMVKIRI